LKVLCEENIDIVSCLYSGPHVKYADMLQRSEEDELLGYQCALTTLGKFFICSHLTNRKHRVCIFVFCSAKYSIGL